VHISAWSPVTRSEGEGAGPKDGHLELVVQSGLVFPDSPDPNCIVSGNVSARDKRAWRKRGRCSGIQQEFR
jgi:hypothetical protein